MEKKRYETPQMDGTDSGSTSRATRPQNVTPSSPYLKSNNIERCSVVVIGAGPYGLSAAAHLIRAGVNVRVFGEPMESWTRHMPNGMLLRSRWEASHIGDPDHKLGLGSFEAASGLELAEPVPLASSITGAGSRSTRLRGWIGAAWLVFPPTRTGSASSWRTGMHSGRRGWSWPPG